MLRASSYNIYVDLPDNPHEMLLVHGYTGAYDKVSTAVARYVRSLEVRRDAKPLHGHWSVEADVGGEVPRPSLETINVLRRRGYLTDMAVDSETEYLVTLAERLHRLSSRRVQYIFMPTYDCNLRCPYCFQGYMRTDPAFQKLLRPMAPELIDRIFAAMPELEMAHAGQALSHRNIGFFGGEPLLAQSRSVIDHIMCRAREAGTATFWAVTNGTELNHYWDVLNPQGISHLQITLDGPPAEHDRRRVHIDGAGTFDMIATNIDRALDQDVSISLRINLDRNNLQHVPALAAEIEAQGWSQRRQFNAYAAPITASKANADRQHLLNSWSLRQALTELRAKFPEIGVISTPDDKLRLQTRRIFSDDPSPDPLDFMQSSFCSAHTGMYIFDAFGDIYACWERTGDPKIRLGSVAPSGDIVLDDAANLQWRSRTVAMSKPCRECRYALHCGGGCAVLAEAQNGGFFTNHCDGYAKRFRASVAQAYLEHTQGIPMQSMNAGVCDL